MAFSPAISMLTLAALINFYGATVAMAQSKDYLDYHLEKLEIEELIAKSEFVESAYAYREFLDSYDFVFLRDYQVSSQLAFYTGQKSLGIQNLQTAMQKGWKWKSIRKNPLILDTTLGFIVEIPLSNSRRY